MEDDSGDYTGAINGVDIGMGSYNAISNGIRIGIFVTGASKMNGISIATIVSSADRLNGIGIGGIVAADTLSGIAAGFVLG